MPGLDLATITKAPAAPKLERGPANASTGDVSPFADLMQECASELASATKTPYTPAEEAAPDESSDTAAEEIPDLQIAYEGVAMLIPAVVSAPIGIPIPVQALVEPQPDAQTAENPVGAASPTITSAPTQTLNLTAAGSEPAQQELFQGLAPASDLAEPALSRTGADTLAVPTPAKSSGPADEVQPPIQSPLSMSTEESNHTLAQTEVAREKPSATTDRQIEIHPETAPQSPDRDGSDEGQSLALDTSVDKETAPKLKATGESAQRDEPQPREVAALASEPRPESTSAPVTASRVSMASIPHTIVRLASDPEQKTQTVKIRLDPPRLGEVSVDLKMGENGLSLRIVSQSPEARDLLQQDLPRLQEVLKASGLNLQLFSASCDLSGERPQRQAPPTFDRGAQPAAKLSQVSEGSSTFVRRQYETSIRINAHA